LKKISGKQRVVLKITLCWNPTFAHWIYQLTCDSLWRIVSTNNRGWHCWLVHRFSEQRLTWLGHFAPMT